MSDAVSKESSGHAANASSSKQSPPDSKASDKENPDNEEAVFKMPIKLQPKRAAIIKASNKQENVVAEDGSSGSKLSVNNSQSHYTMPNFLAPIPYNVPDWGGFPGRVYWFEIIKGGQIIGKFDLGLRSWHAIGRSPVNDIVMLHPTMSRFHAVIQFRDNEKGTAENPPGMYIFDMGSVHGTFLNKNRIEEETYIRVHVGHVIKFGGSTRHLILHGPKEEEEEESHLTVTEIQNKRSNELIRRQLDELKCKVPDEEQGISWGMDDDANEETDLATNPFASNEELYIGDPKKTLRGWFEREGHELTYMVEEKSCGVFHCQIKLPVDSQREMIAEYTAVGKKKEAVLKCALEACRILDEEGVLRQSTHESKKRKAKDWAADDYYDSDDDTFLDRTGTVEKKRKARMGAMIVTKPLTYSDLLKDREEVMKKITNVTATLTAMIQAGHQGQGVQDKEIGIDDDSLDNYMKTLRELPDPKDANRVSELRMTRNELKTEAIRITGLLNRVRPLCVPEFSDDIENPSTNPNIHRRMSALNRKAQILSKKRKNVNKGSVKEPDTSDFKLESLDAKSDCEDTKLPRSDQSTHIYHVKNTNINIHLTPATMDGLLEGKTVKSGSVKADVAVGEAKILDVSPELLEGENTAKKIVDEPKGEGKNVLEGTKKKRNRKKFLPKNAKPQKERQQTTSEWLNERAFDWLPPLDQSGDGRTSLNDKLGY